MTARVLAADAAADRLAELGLSIDLVERVVRRADAEAAFCTLFDPPIMEGLTRWARTNRFLREALVPLGRIDDGRITRWAERIILPGFPRDGVRLADGLASPDSAGDRGIVVEVSPL